MKRLLVPVPKPEELQSRLDSLILSASGWRKVFAADGEEESPTPDVAPADQYIVAAMALAFGRKIIENGEKTSVVAVATDSRPTGPLLADIIIRVLTSLKIAVRYSGITAIPELLSAVQRDASISGFAYVSASHNPIGHNGLKFGFSDGGVAGGEASSELISSFRDIINDESPDLVVSLIADADPSILGEIESARLACKDTTYDHYARFTRLVAANAGTEEEAYIFFRALRRAAARRPLGVVAELNGSARSLTIDREILEEVGVKVHPINDVPGRIVHRIVPEGSSLDPCRNALEALHRDDPSYFVGYVPDNDGDRGNLVYSCRDGNARVLHAQDVFALACLAELAYLAYDGMTAENSDDYGPICVVANGPTSMRVDEIAQAFGAKVERAEVGEANVVNLARELRTAGITVRILGEGSNGGNITHPATCRDPLNTIFSILKLLLIRSEGGRSGLFELWCRAGDRTELYREDFVLEDIIASLPRYATTSAYEERAIMKINSTDHGALKVEYEAIFQDRWPEIRRELEPEIGIVDYEILNYEGTFTRRGIGNRDPLGGQRGGLKVLLKTAKSDVAAYMWMRGSGTEPVFRILVDVRGDKVSVEKRLLLWQRSMIEEADARTAGRPG